MTDITVLNRKRGGIKSQITKLNYVLTEGQSTMDIPELQAQLDLMMNIQQKYDALKESYYSIAKEEEFQKVESSLIEIDDDLQKIEVSLKTSIYKLKSAKVLDKTDYSKNNNEQSKNTSIKLPKIPLPFFYGKFEEWNLFKAEFNSLISANAELSENEKLYYLRGSLKGDAKIVQTADDNFSSLFKALEQRYENKRIIVNCHIKNILNIHPLKHESGKDLRNVLDTILKNLRSLKLLEFARDKLSDALLLNIVLDKLDRDSRKQYELTLKDNDVPKFDDFLEFLERRCQILNNIQTNVPSKFINERSKSFFVKAEKSPKLCIACKTQTHALYHCNAFKEMKLSERLDLVHKNQLCKNCLSEFHPLSKCNSKSSCFVCKKKLNHHTLLHKYSSAPSHSNLAGETDIATPAHFEGGNQQINNSQSINRLMTDHQLSFFCNGNKSVLINTAIIYIRDTYGEFKALRAIFDSASESSFISSFAAEVLGLKKEKINIPICGLNETSLNIRKKVSAVLSNENKDSFWEIDLLIVPNITNLTPSKRLNISNLNIPRQVKLADPSFHIPQKIDILLGAELFFSLLNEDKIKLADNLFLQSSKFGYLVSGVISHNNFYNTPKHCFLTNNLDNLNKTLKRFWEIEEVEAKENYSDELKYCNEHFAKTHFRKPDGKYVVEMPFKPDSSKEILGNSKAIASKRLDQLWTRLERDPAMKTLYSEFLSEYELLQHMEEVKEDSDIENGYYLPHHGVLRPSNKTTKLRVVFNGSAKTTSGYSLNDFLCKGGVLQEDLFSILIRFRKHIFAFTTDIKMMFRMINIHPSQHKFQKILWKDSNTSPIKVFQLSTITYGTKCAPYLATRVLQQLAEDECNEFPLASKIVQQDFYMDDCLSGSSDLQEFEAIQTELKELLQKGGMTLHKWCTNNSQTAETKTFSLDRNSEETTVKTLGMLWNSTSDIFTYKVNITSNENFTKRLVLSQIARIYDPLGLLGPLTAKCKIFMQQLWLLKLGWNDLLPPDISQQWKDFTTTLPQLEAINIPRCFLKGDVKSVVLHGFADASSKAYGAVVYIHSVNKENEVTSRLLCSKSRVAPTKVMTIPRLELSACLLLAKLINKVLPALKHPVDDVRFWTDSTIALAWIGTPAHQLKTFVGHRVVEINELSKNYVWSHVESNCNPADVISRGLDVKGLITSELWWHGPKFLHSSETPKTLPIDLDLTDMLYTSELKAPSEITLICHSDSNFFDNLLDLTNHFPKLIRILAFIFRFITNCKKYHVLKGPLSATEFNRAENFVLKQIQVKYFASEIADLKKGNAVRHNSKLKFLNPFLDLEGLIRVGGRLAHSNLSYDAKYPIVLPAGNKLTKMIFQYYHLRDFHVGPQTLLNTVRQKYWPISGRNIARKVAHECVTCFKAKPIVASQLMGNLPPERVTPSFTFSNVGLDLCGPFDIKYKGQRKGTLQKIYVVIFVCMVTKAVHIEFVSDLTTEGIIATLKRFFARRGRSSVIFSDNATNFIGASAEFKRLHKLIGNEEISSHFASEGITWKFSPPRAPNFGGLWEAGVKAFKHHLKRVMGSARLTLEEFLTVIIQIEGILNSRPLSPMSADANDFQVLTPGHFLVGRPINAIPEPNLITRKDNLLNHWQRAQKMVQLIWKCWQNNYLSHLQERSKWLLKKPNILPGMLVLLKDPQLPICTWSLARIVKTFPGADGNVRVVELRTPKGNFKRPVTKICILPIADNFINS